MVVENEGNTQVSTMTESSAMNLVDSVYANDGKKQNFYRETHEVFHGAYRILIIGDIHASDKPSAVHTDYFASCTRIFEDITETIKERKITHLILTGDLVGRTTEKNFQTREALMYFQKLFMVWNKLTDGHVYSDVGNHDMGEYLTDFEYLVSVECIKVVDSIEFDSLKLHIIKYGEDYKELDIAPNKMNVAVMHTELHVEGATGWFFRSHEGKDLSDMLNLKGIDMVVCGHIHDPSEVILETSIEDHPIKLFYPGNLTRPKKNNLWTEAYGVVYESEGVDVHFSKEIYELEPFDEFFKQSIDDLSEELKKKHEEAVENGEIEDALDLSELSDIMATITHYNLAEGVDYEHQIKALAGGNERVEQLAISTIQEIESEFKDRD